MCNSNQFQCEKYKSLMSLSLMFSKAQVVSFLICIRLFLTPGVLRCRRPKLLPVWKSMIWASGSTPSCEMSSTLPVVRKSWIQFQPDTEFSPNWFVFKPNVKQFGAKLVFWHFWPKLTWRHEQAFHQSVSSLSSCWKASAVQSVNMTRSKKIKNK